MLILTIRTDKPEAEIGLYEDQKRLVYHIWPAHRQLAETIHSEIKKLLVAQDRQLSEVKGLLVFSGPGSFTGLRIGVSVANALAASLSAPIVATNGPNWLATGVDALTAGRDEGQVTPDYGAEPRTTIQKK